MVQPENARLVSGYDRRLRFEPLEDRRVLSITMDIASRAAISGDAAGSSTLYDDIAPHNISADGRYIVFLSGAQNLVEGFSHFPGIDDVYRFDRVTGDVDLISVSIDGETGANSSSYQPTISADGNVVAFASYGSNLHAADNVGEGIDIFARNVATGNTYLVSARLNGAGSESYAGASWFPVISADGNIVAFRSNVSDLHPLDIDSNLDIFARNLSSGEIQLVTVNSAGNGTGNENSFGISVPEISGDGSTVIFSSAASNLHPLDTDSEEDVFARNLATGVTYLVSTNQSGSSSGNGRSWNANVSADGKVVVFMSDASDLDAIDQDPGRRERDTDIFVRNLATGVTQLVSINSTGSDSGTSGSTSPVISADGTVVAFESGASNLVALTVESHNIYARNLATGVTYLVSINAEGTGSGEHEGSFDPVISADGRVVTFMSNDTSLHPLDTDDEDDVYARDLLTGTTYLLSIASTGVENGDGSSHDPRISADGTHVVFASEASNLIEGDLNDAEDVFVASIVLAPQLPGDYNGDGHVNSADYTVWRNTTGQVDLTPYSGADGNGDGDITYDDYLVWKQHYGETLDDLGTGSSERGAASGSGEEIVSARVKAQTDSSPSTQVLANAPIETFVPLRPESWLGVVATPQIGEATDITAIQNLGPRPYSLAPARDQAILELFDRREWGELSAHQRGGKLIGDHETLDAISYWRTQRLAYDVARKLPAISDSARQLA